MTTYEYKVVPAPKRGLKAKGLRTVQERFANAMQTQMNELAAQGWDFQRADTLPVEERQGLTGKTTSFQTMLVFRRAVCAQAEAAPALIEDRTAQDAQLDADDTPDNGGDEAPAKETQGAAFNFPWSARQKRKGSAGDDAQVAAE